MKKVLSICLVIIMMLSVFAISASATPVVIGGDADVRNGGLYYIIDEDNKTATVVGYELKDENASAGKLTVPEKITYNEIQYTVIGVGYGAFYQSMYTEIVLPSSITYIDDMAFSSSAYLAKVVVDENCVLDYVGSNLFMGTPYEEKIYENDVTILGKNVLYKCNSDGTFIIPDKITVLASNAFMWSDVEKVIFNDKITEIPMGCFASCSRLNEVVMSDSITIIGDGAFMDCTSLENITLGNCVSVIGEDCFANTQIKSIHLTREVNHIGGAFKNCALESITIDPNNTTLSTNGKMVYQEGTFFEFDKNGHFISVEGKVLMYCIPQYAKGSITLPTMVMAIGSYAFYDCDELDEVKAGKLYYIYPGAFQNSSIKSFNSEGIMATGQYMIFADAFKNCKNLTTINLKGVSYIDDSAFENCISLENVQISNDIMTIGAKAFSNTGIKEIEITSNNNCTIEEGAFMNCQYLEKVKLGEGVTRLGTNAFLECPNLKTVSLSKTIEVFDDNALNGCENVNFEVVKGTAGYKLVNKLEFNFTVVGKITFWQRIIAFFVRLFS